MGGGGRAFVIHRVGGGGGNNTYLLQVLPWLYCSFLLQTRSIRIYYICAMQYNGGGGGGELPVIVENKHMSPV